MTCLRPVFIPFGFEGGPDADPEHQQVEHEGGHQPRDVKSHADSQGEQKQCCVQPRYTDSNTSLIVCAQSLGGAANMLLHTSETNCGIYNGESGMLSDKPVK